MNEKEMKSITDVIDAATSCLRDIVFIHPEDLEKLDLDEIPDCVWFLTSEGVEKGKAFELVDGEMKVDIYKKCKAFPKYVIKGRKKVGMK